MELFHSSRLFAWGILKRGYYWLPTLILDPFDIYNTYIRYWMPKDRQGKLAMPNELGLLVFCLLLIWAAILTYHEIRKEKMSLEASKRIPKNRDAHIARFTELGERAKNYIRARHVYTETRKKYGRSLLDGQLERDILHAKTSYQEAQLAVWKEIKIAGGTLDLFLPTHYYQISGRVLDETIETDEDSPTTQYPEISDSVSKAIDVINKGNRPIPRSSC